MTMNVSSQTSPKYRDYTALVSEVCDIAREAAEKILRVYDTDFAIEHKDDLSPLTKADMAAHDCIVKRLKALTPDLPILSEESAEVDYATRSQWNAYWLVDPLDGTREFIKRNDEFTVNIALIERHEPVLGVVQVPVTGVCYSASANHGAYKSAAGVSPFPIQTRRAQPDHLAIAGSRSHGSESFQGFIDSLDSAEVVNIGSSLKSCLIAEGKVDLYPRFGPTSEWDTGAAQCIVEQAGGRVTDMDFNRLLYNTKPSVINPSFLVIGDPDFDWAPYLTAVRG